MSEATQIPDETTNEPAAEPTTAPVTEPKPEAAPEPKPDNVIWPDQWRDQMAGEDPEGKRRARLERFDSPNSIFESYIQLEEKFKSTKPQTPFPAEGSDEEKAQWRESQGIPNDVNGYFENMPDGLVIGEDDQAGMQMLAERLHSVNAPPEVVHAAVSTYYEYIENAIANRAQEDKQYKTEMEESLREHYGADFRGNITDLDVWMNAAPGDVRNKLLSSRMPDGKPLGSDPDVIKWFVSQMREINPRVIVPGLGEGDPMENINGEIAKIEERMRSDFSGYKADAKMQARYLELIAARDKQTVKAG